MKLLNISVILSRELVGDKCCSSPELWRTNENVVQVSIVIMSDQCVVIKWVDKMCISYTLVQSILKWPENWRNSCVMHHNTTAFDASLTVQKLLVKKSIPSVPQLAVSETPDWAQMPLSCVCRRNSTECDSRPQSHTKRGLPEVLLGMAELWD